MNRIMSQLENGEFIYRDKLSIPEQINFGLEMELDKVDFNEVSRLVKKKFGGNYHVKPDKSLTLGCNAEITTPKLQNTKYTWVTLKKIGFLLESLTASYDKCSFQVNFDGSLLPSVEDRVRFLKLYAMYEDIIYRFSKGGDNCYRDSLDTYASPIILTLKGVLKINSQAVIEMFSNQKRYGIAFKTMGCDLIEFRTPNMSNNPLYWQNYINAFYYLIRLVISGKYDKKEVDEYIDKFNKIYILEAYEKESTDKALKLCQAIFPRTLDTTNFMHQYLKN